ncbi:hypothetical protein CMUST_14905 [Corynebacterium mustelae]|uniref:Uncharacterized protein n=1 Tax=Corynebacterium mustelae TaxID=571915 RepID=A0A0G3GVS6_9CORY|nr:hypothetical protein CMUST_04615 [Corynebacterium mustelae]AKK05859.1 hypothetical protein CMUST_07655 [Corynebacterium mustelae]AKK06846.1 hypothetical protein CMUST_12720 [Corynebacterium mustelae]AKK07271.1 hypothetical protein CMUST_14905 [Corynebacterium mustelae]
MHGHNARVHYTVLTQHNLQPATTHTGSTRPQAPHGTTHVIPDTQQHTNTQKFLYTVIFYTAASHHDNPHPAHTQRMHHTTGAVMLHLD